MPFSALGLTPDVCQVVSRLGFTTPTPVQAQSIPLVLTGGDLIAKAQTGTGKTAAFGLPMIERLQRGTGAARRAPRALVLVPTRELAVQVHGNLGTYGRHSHLRVTAIYGGVGMGPQMSDLRHGTDIVVATPGRLIDHLERKTVDLSHIEVLVLDEADRMLDMGFQPALKRILPLVPASRQTLLFSATLPASVESFCAAITRNPARVDVAGDEVVAATVVHQVRGVSLAEKRDVLTDLLKAAGDEQTLVFCKTKRGSDRVGKGLTAAGLNVAVIHGDKSQGQRVKALAAFKGKRATVLVATDIAARGIDVVQLPLVINYDLPLVPEDYIHRVGRTGRAGHPGRAISSVAPDDVPLLRDIQKLLPTPIEQVGGVAIDLTSAPQGQRPGPRGGQRQGQRGQGQGARGQHGPRQQRRQHPGGGPRSGHSAHGASRHGGQHGRPSSAGHVRDEAAHGVRGPRRQGAPGRRRGEHLL